ncbi:endonuclease [Polaribacter sp. L3A8]|uniref:endonuclease n=1 Tax=Polaribacter sp. L3A8 TaxID=2686361 RepID=UPI00131CDB46|nr:endonuclease [Polaribacter sp. L3A8]
MKKIVLLASLFVTLIVSAQQPYYTGVNLTKSGLDLKDELAVKTISAHTNPLSYTPGIWEASKITDVDPTNADNVLLIYGYNDSDGNYITDRTRSKSLNGGTDGSDWNREHTYANSLANPKLESTGKSGPPYAEAFNLRPSDVKMNSNRGNLKFAEGSGNAGTVSGGWYPGDEWKGDVARMMMYMYIRYGDQCKPTGVGVGNLVGPDDEMIDLFLEWNVEDPVSDFERQRNTYHDSNETYAQGNRNPFIDNAYFATRIWGGDAAIDSWGMYTSNDSEAPTVPTSVVLNNATTSTIEVSWSASTDNEAVTAYEIYVNGTLNGKTATTTYKITGLNSNTAYSITVLAKDIASNKSAQSTAANGTTLTDTSAPTIPTNVTITSQSGTSFKVNWTAATDDTAVTSYDVFVDGVLNGSTTTLSYDVTSLSVSTTYAVSVLAKDAANNKSAQTNTINATTTDGSAATNQIFFSEYIEGSGNNKAIEIANFTGQTVSLANYAVKLAANGQNFGTNTLTFTNETIANGDVFVIGNAQITICTSEVDISSNVTYFNGDDVLGLFKNDVLIDIIGKEGVRVNFGKNVTLKRKPTIISTNTVYNADEWIETSTDDCSDLGKHTISTASVNTSDFTSFKMYPNPVTGNTVHFKTVKDVEVTIYTVLGKLVKTTKITATKNNIDISTLSKGIYLLKLNTENQFITKKLVKNN